MLFIKALLTRAKNYKHRIEIAVTNARVKAIKECEKRAEKDLNSTRVTYERIIADLKEQLSDMKYQHERDIMAFRLYKKDLDVLEELYNDIEPDLEKFMTDIIGVIRIFLNKKRQTFNLIRTTKKKSKRITSLLRAEALIEKSMKEGL